MHTALFPRLLLYGFTTYAAIFMLWSFFSAYNLAAGTAPRVTSWVATALVVAVAARLLKLDSFKQTLICGAVWALMHFLLDAVYVMPAVGLIAFGTYFAWVNYAIVFAAPFVVLLFSMFTPSPQLADQNVAP